MDFSNLNRPQITLMGSAFCVVLSLHFTLQLVSQHLFYWKNPKEQKAILIIILMAPLYALVSFVGLLDVKGSKAFFMFLESVKECYEALVIAKFMALMYSYLNISISKNIVPDEIKGREIHHSFPMTLFQPRTVRLNHNTIKLLKYWTWQFVVIRPVCSVLMITLQVLRFYPSWLSWTFTIILNVSVSLALYSLVAFYHVFAKELEPHKPLAKFMCIKGIVFFCFWQGVVLDILVAVGFIKSHHFWLDVEHLEEALQNILVCLEMAVFSVLQQYAYHVYPYSGDVKGGAGLSSTGFIGGLISLWNEDVVQVTDQYVHSRFFALVGKFKNGPMEFVVINVYGTLVEAEKEDFYGELLNYVTPINLPVCLGGDFNAYLDPKEKMGKSQNWHTIDIFRSFVQHAKLINLPVS